MKESVTCAICGTTFERDSREIKRSQKLGRRQFCSRACVGKSSVDRLAQYRGAYDISKHAGHHRDGFSGLREFIRRINNRQGTHTITLDHLKDVWDRQSGICPYSGIQLKLPRGKGRQDRVYTASLDRIDSTKPYEEGNLQFVSTIINFMKSDLSHEQTIEFIELLRK